MAATKTFETLFAIGARYTGGPAFAAAGKSIDSVEQKAKGAGQRHGESRGEHHESRRRAGACGWGLQGMGKDN